MLKTLKGALVALVLILFGLACSLGAIELAFRLIHRAPQTWSDRPFAYFKNESSATLQDYNYSSKRPANVFRIAVIGDSYSFAPYMQFTDAFPKILERMLNLNNISEKVEVINYGVPAYSSSHEIASVKKALEEESNLIILQITLNDPELKPYRPTGITEFGRFGEYKPSGLNAFLCKYWRSYAYVRSRLHNTATHREYKKYFFDLFENPRGLRVFKKSLAEMKELSQQAGAPMVGVVFPLFGEPLDESYPFLPLHKLITDFLTELGAPALDLHGLYKGIPLERLQVIPGVDRHPNEIAHRMAAEQLYLWLFDQQLIPAKFKIKELFKERTGIIKMPPFVDAP